MRPADLSESGASSDSGTVKQEEKVDHPPLRAGEYQMQVHIIRVPWPRVAPRRGCAGWVLTWRAMCAGARPYPHRCERIGRPQGVCGSFRRDA